MLFYLIFMICFFVISAIVVIKNGNNPFAMSENKYPPTLLYVSYGTSISLGLMLLLSKMEPFLKGLLITKSITFLSKNSFQLYLWHILGLFLTTNITNKFIKIILVFVVSFIGTILYESIKKMIFKDKKASLIL